jgi:hypothetical protein
MGWMAAYSSVTSMARSYVRKPCTITVANRFLVYLEKLPQRDICLWQASPQALLGALLIISGTRQIYWRTSRAR